MSFINGLLKTFTSWDNQRPPLFYYFSVGKGQFSNIRFPLFRLYAFIEAIFQVNDITILWPSYDHSTLLTPRHTGGPADRTTSVSYVCKPTYSLVYICTRKTTWNKSHFFYISFSITQSKRIPKYPKLLNYSSSSRTPFDSSLGRVPGEVQENMGPIGTDKESEEKGSEPCEKKRRRGLG